MVTGRGKRRLANRIIIGLSSAVGWLGLTAVLWLAVVVTVALRRGFHVPPFDAALLLAITAGLTLAATGVAWLAARSTSPARRPPWWEATLHLVALMGLAGAPLDPGFIVALDLAVASLAMVCLWRVHVTLAQRLHRPAQLLPLSFLALIVAGALLIKLPVAVPPGQTLSWVDAVFTMTSAVCVTGLIVRDTATQFTPVGQAIIGVFIQIGGLGIIVFGSMLVLLIGRRISLREQLSLSEMLNEQPAATVGRTVFLIVGVTLAVEAVGALALWLTLESELVGWRRIGFALFHSVSAYCNAGFALYTDSVESHRYGLAAHGVIAPLIVLGGLGYPVFADFARVIRQRLRPRPNWRSASRLIERQVDRPGLTLHTRIVLATTASLYLAGVLLIGAGQLMPRVTDAAGLNVTAHRAQPEPMSAGAMVRLTADASFLSITARTAGFNAMPMDDLSPAGRLVTMGLMVIGGSPGGTAGGVRTTTFALLILAVVAGLTQRRDVEAFGRRVPESLIRKAATIAAIYGGVIGLVAFLLSLVEPFPFVTLLFETVSAVTVTGLSLGVTGQLTTFGKIVIIGAMFAGRIGPLILLSALILRTQDTRRYRYPAEEIVIG